MLLLTSYPNGNFSSYVKICIYLLQHFFFLVFLVFNDFVSPAFPQQEFLFSVTTIRQPQLAKLLWDCASAMCCTLL